MNSTEPKHVEATTSDAMPSIQISQWSMLLGIGSLVLALFVVGWVGHVEVTSRGRGVVQVSTGPQPVLSELSGEVGKVLVQAGDRVEAGQLIAELRHTPLQARDRRLASQLEALEEHTRNVRDSQEPAYREGVAALNRRRKALQQQLTLTRNRIQTHAGRARAMAMLGKEGAASGGEVLAAQNDHSSALEAAYVLRQQIANTDLELADRARDFELDRLELRRRLKEARLAHREANTLLAATSLRAAETGIIESLLVTEGQVIVPGLTAARVIPNSSEAALVAFVPAKDGAFIRPGLTGVIEFDALPVSEFGRPSAIVRRVGADAASADELAAAFGESAASLALEQPLLRVELTPTPSATWERAAAFVQSGSPFSLKLQTRNRRVLGLLFDFARKWLPNASN